MPRKTRWPKVDPHKVRVAKVLEPFNGPIGDRARGFLDGFKGRPPRTDAPYQESYEDGWLAGAMADTNVRCRHCKRHYGQHTRACLVDHYGDRDPACGCDECHKGTSPTPLVRSIELECWEPLPQSCVRDSTDPNCVNPWTCTQCGRTGSSPYCC